jgi:hypothetical protein
MESKLVIVGVLLIIVGIIKHFIPKGILPRIGYHLDVPGYLIAGIGIILLIAGLLLG